MTPTDHDKDFLGATIRIHTWTLKMFQAMAKNPLNKGQTTIVLRTPEAHMKVYARLYRRG